MFLDLCFPTSSLLLGPAVAPLDLPGVRDALPAPIRGAFSPAASTSQVTPPQARTPPHLSCDLNSGPSILVGTHHPPGGCPRRVPLRQLQAGLPLGPPLVQGSVAAAPVCQRRHCSPSPVCTLLLGHPDSQPQPHPDASQARVQHWPESPGCRLPLGTLPLTSG